LEAHVELLEAQLRAAGLTPPPRPALTREGGAIASEDASVVPVETQVSAFRDEVQLLNALDPKFSPVLRRLRQVSQDEKSPDREEAGRLLAIVEAWVQARLDRMAAQQTADPVGAYIIVQDMMELLQHDELAQPFRERELALRLDRGQHRELLAGARLRNTLRDAENLGLLEGLTVKTLHNPDTAPRLRGIAASLQGLARLYPETDAARAAQRWIKRWSDQEQELRNRKPAWTYTWQIQFIERDNPTINVTVIDYGDKSTGHGTQVIHDIDYDIYEQRKVRLVGSFQNHASQTYRYTFNVGALGTQLSGNSKPGDFGPTTRRVLGFSRLQTPPLAPGELYNFETEVTVPDIDLITGGGVGRVEPHRVEHVSITNGL
jgi:hypothetical protein